VEPLDVALDARQSGLSRLYRGHVYAARTHTRPAKRRHSAMRPVGQQGTTLELTAREAWLLG
jgi:hypothetical protein